MEHFQWNAPSILGAKRRGFIKSESILAPKGVSRLRLKISGMILVPSQKLVFDFEITITLNEIVQIQTLK